MTNDQSAFARLMEELFQEQDGTPSAQQNASIDAGQLLVERAEWLSQPEIYVRIEGNTKYFTLGISSTSQIIWDEGLVVRVQDGSLAAPSWVTDLAVQKTASAEALAIAACAVGEQAWQASEERTAASGGEVTVRLNEDQARDLRAGWGKLITRLRLETAPLSDNIFDDKALAQLTSRWTMLHTAPSRGEPVAARADAAPDDDGLAREWDLDDEAVARDLAGTRYSARDFWPLLALVIEGDHLLVRLSRMKGAAETGLRIAVRFKEGQAVLLEPEEFDGEHLLQARIPRSAIKIPEQRPAVTTYRVAS